MRTQELTLCFGELLCGGVAGWKTTVKASEMFFFSIETLCVSCADIGTRSWTMAGRRFRLLRRTVTRAWSSCSRPLELIQLCTLLRSNLKACRVNTEIWIEFVCLCNNNNNKKLLPRGQCVVFDVERAKRTRSSFIETRWAQTETLDEKLVKIHSKSSIFHTLRTHRASGRASPGDATRARSRYRRWSTCQACLRSAAFLAREIKIQ